MYVCSCFGITEQQVKEHADAGACTPRQIASASKAGTDCGSCVRRIQALLGRGSCPRRDLADQGEPALSAAVPGPSASASASVPAAASVSGLSALREAA
ncbi:(2Fe-2S)-binding protein [Streptomyces yaizuensis]|uniref:Bacterioferritin-associated ferredoxin n=1 Tax=Streptomyces yaizuensis TaxID=2989713 RepID=A0ABQ5NUW4_9ACTN|nr:(2Fe-2S)-binding protein [Streptomyces sp. YSPA8]GLF94153.1 (2Fe-2S)-binding protein [Streptomyces sp. YSPA8]